MISVAVPLRLRSQPLKIKACPNCGRPSWMDWAPNRKWFAVCGSGGDSCGRFMQGYEWADTALKAFLDKQGRVYNRNE